MPLSTQLKQHIADYLKRARDSRELAEKPEYARLKPYLFDLAAEWARLAGHTGQAGNDADARVERTTNAEAAAGVRSSIQLRPEDRPRC